MTKRILAGQIAAIAALVAQMGGPDIANEAARKMPKLEPLVEPRIKRERTRDWEGQGNRKGKGKRSRRRNKHRR